MDTPQLDDTPDLNSGTLWSELAVKDLRSCISQGRTVEATARFLCRSEKEVEEKMVELDLLWAP
jgi:hypothetical protein